MTDALEDHEGTVSIRGRTITNLCFADDVDGLANSRPVHSLMLSSHLFLCVPCLLPPFNVPCKMVLARPDELETCSYHFSLRVFTVVSRSSCGLIACQILAQTSSLVTWSLYEMHSILQQYLIFMACIISVWLVRDQIRKIGAMEMAQLETRKQAVYSYLNFVLNRGFCAAPTLDFCLYCLGIPQCVNGMGFSFDLF